MVHALVSRRVVLPSGERAVAVVIDGEKIVELKKPYELDGRTPAEKLGDAVLLPGLVDLHTHLNEPGRTEWEGFATGTRAAAAGGFTTVCDMPLNCLPETTNVAALEEKRRAAAGQCTVDYALWGGAVDGNHDELQALAQAGVAGFKCFLIYPGCDGFTAIDAANLELALPEIAKLDKPGKPLLVHAELAAPIDKAMKRLEREGADWRSYATWLASRPDEAEIEAIELMLSLCRRYRFRLHIVHLSTARALPLIKRAKREGLPVTVETCPHYLHGAAEDIADGATLWKCAPPIRGRENREKLWEALRVGLIDCVATDHSPCPPHMKRLDLTAEQLAHGQEAGRFDEAWGGIASLSTALPVMFTEYVRRGFELDQLAAWMSSRPARIAGLGEHLGEIKVGHDANFVAIDAEASWVVEERDLYHRHAVSPYLGETLQGRVVSTWLRGRKVFDRGAFPEKPFGREHGV